MSEVKNQIDTLTTNEQGSVERVAQLKKEWHEAIEARNIATAVRKAAERKAMELAKKK